MKELPVTELTQTQYDNLIQDLRAKIWVLIKSIKILLEKSGTFDTGNILLREESHIPAIASLYTHAIEQLGKLKMVQGCSKNSSGKYDLSPISRDFYDHVKKLNKAFENIQDPTWLDIFKLPGTPIVLQTRLNLLHSDIDENGNITEMPDIDIEKFKIAIEAFHTEQFSH